MQPMNDFAPTASQVVPEWSGIAMSAIMTRGRPILLGIGLLILGACTAPIDTAADEPGFIKELPEQVVLMAAPYQNLQEVILKPEDGCYWYRYVGLVETVMLPLRTVEGRPICTRVEGQPPATN